MRNAAEIAVRAGKSYGADNCSVFAGGVTYYALMSLFPLMLFALSVAGFVFSDEADQQELVDRLLDTLPIDEATGREDLEAVIENVVNARGALGIIGILGSMYSASALFGAVRTALNAVLTAESKRNFAIGKGMDILAVMFFAGLLLLSIGVTVALTLVRQSSEDVLGAEAAVWVERLLSVALALVPVLVSSVIFFLLFKLVPAKQLNTRSVLWGAVVSAVLFEALKLGFAYYATHFGNFNATYGTIGFLIVLLVFFNFSAQIMLIGAEVARARWEFELDEQDRFRETAAIGEKVHGLLSKVPLLKRRFPPHDSAPSRSRALARDHIEAAPVAVSAAPASLPVEPEKPRLEARRPRPPSWAGAAMLGTLFLAFLATSIRRR